VKVLYLCAMRRRCAEGRNGGADMAGQKTRYPIPEPEKPEPEPEKSEPEKPEP